MSSNLVLYFKHRLNQSSATATRNNLNWGGTCYLTPLIGAFVADAYLGRYWTIASFSTIYVAVSFTYSKLLIISTVHALNFNLLIIVQSQLLLMKRLKLKRAFH
jgi:peptide/histidine transporter 3/4